MTKGIIFNIQRFSTHDGPGIRTVVFIKGCPLRCYWCQNPESQSVSPVLMQKSELCVGCGACALACPNGAASLREGKCRIDRVKCRGCGVCAKQCRTESLVLSGYEATVDEVMEEVMKDRSYYLNSGGGVTLSGGEPTGQADFAIELLRACKRKYIHTAVETCGFASQQVMHRFASVTDLFLYDLKAVDSAKHRRGTGQDNEIIKENARLLASLGKQMVVRMPLIPNYNDNAEAVAALRSFVCQELGLGSDHIELLKYNQLGEVKFERLGREDRPSMRPQSDEYFEELKRLLL